MADEKISDLTELAAVSIDGTEETVIEKGGANFRQKNSSFASRYGLFPAGTLFYNVLLSQSGSNPGDAPTIQNTIQDTIGTPTLARVGAGDYTITKTGAFPAQSKVILRLGGSKSSSIVPSDIVLYWIDANTIGIKTIDVVTVSPADDILSFTEVKIIVLP